MGTGWQGKRILAEFLRSAKKNKFLNEENVWNWYLRHVYYEKGVLFRKMYTEYFTELSFLNEKYILNDNILSR